jgi:hypothetical protein
VGRIVADHIVSREDDPMLRSAAFTVACLTAFAVTAAAEDAQSILAKVRAKQIERLAGVDRYAVDKTVMGNRATIVYERFDAAGTEGVSSPAFRAVPITSATSGGDAGVDTSTMMGEYAKGLEMVGAGLSSEMDKGLEQAGLPPGLFEAMGAGADPWASPDPGAMMTGMAPIAADMGGAEGRLEREASANAAAEAAQMRAFADKASLVGTESIDGREAFHLRAENLDQTQQIDGQTFAMNVADVWIDASEYVPLRSKIEGIATSAGESRPVVLDSVNSDYRRVSGSTMYEPFRQSVRMSGLMSPEQQAEMQTAAVKLDEMEAQLAQMPESQRQMVMSQMGPQLEMMRKMSAGGGLELETVVHQIVVNPDAAALQAMQSESVSIAGQSLPMLATGSSAMPVGGAASAGNQDPDVRKKAQQACLAEKVREAEEAKKKKRGLGSLMSAVGRVASKFGGVDVTSAIGDVYTANATAEDLAAAARDLGLTEEDVADCQNPR